MLRRSLIALSCSLSISAALPAVVDANVHGTWVGAGALSAAHQAALSVRLPDGGALVAGGSNTATAERYNPVTNTWAPAASMGTTRAAAATVTLADGRVLAAGGTADGYAPLTTAEIFDPATGTWSPTGSMQAARSWNRGVLLADGRVLVVGGNGGITPSTGAEIWDPATGQWTPTGPTVTPRSGTASVTRLLDGRVLVAGGWDGSTLATAELYDPATNLWTATGPMAERRSGPAAARLPDGRVLIAGGSETTAGIPSASHTSEIYDPATGTFSPAAALAAPRGSGAQGGVLPDGRPFVSGGFLAVLTRGDDGQLRWVEDRIEDTVEIFDPATGTWWQSPKSGTGRSNHAAVALADGTILLAGGERGIVSAQRLYPPGTTPPAPPSVPVPPDGPKPLPVTLPKLSKLPSKLTVSRTGRIAFTLRCTGSTVCSDTLTLRTSKGKRLARTKLTVGANRKATVRLTLSKSALRSVKRGSTKVTLELATRKLTTKATLKRR